MPFRAPVRFIWCTSVTSTRVPDAPIGWPIAIAPPHTFTFDVSLSHGESSYIGRYAPTASDTATEAFFRGEIDDLTIYTAPLDPVKVRAILVMEPLRMRAASQESMSPTLS